MVGSLLHTYPHSFLPLISSWVSLAARTGRAKGAAAGDRRPLTDSDNWQLALLPRDGVKVNVGCSSRNIARPPLRVNPQLPW